MRNAQSEVKVMRDALIEQLFCKMQENEKIFLISADFGAPALDKLREKFKDRFINVGICRTKPCKYIGWFGPGRLYRLCICYRPLYYNEGI